MRILAVDTTSDAIRVAIGDGRSSISSSTFAKGAHDEKLFAEIDRLLRKAKLRLKDVGGLVAASGPGSFTGIRVGMTFVAVLAETTGLPAAGVSLMEAEGERALAAGASAAMVVYPSARDELFVQLFVAGSKPGEPKWIPAELWEKTYQAAARRKALALAGPAAKAAAKRLADVDPPVLAVRPLSAADLIGPALRKIRTGDRDLAPLYLKPAYYERNPPRLVR